MNDRVKVILEEFGLTANESKIYIEALKHDVVSPFELARLCKIPRTTVYDIILNLSLKGLIELKQNKALEKKQLKIRAKNPSILREIIQKRRGELSKLEVDIVDILPNLKQNYFKDSPNADFKFYPGIGGAKEVMKRNSTIHTREGDCAWSYLMPMDTFGKEAINKLITSELDYLMKRQIQLKQLVPLNEWTKHVISYQYQRDKRYIIQNEFRYIDAVGFKMKQEIYLKSDSMSIVNVEDDETWGLVIYSKSLVITFRSIFNFMWSLGRPITGELIESWGRNEFFDAEFGVKNRQLVL